MKRMLTNCLRNKGAKMTDKPGTFNKLKIQFDRDYDSLSWLRCETSDNALVENLWCHACRKYESAITGLKNFSNAWIKGSTNQKTSNVVDHAKSEQHATAMA